MPEPSESFSVQLIEAPGDREEVARKLAEVFNLDEAGVIKAIEYLPATIFHGLSAAEFERIKIGLIKLSENGMSFRRTKAHTTRLGGALVLPARLRDGVVESNQRFDELEELARVVHQPAPVKRVEEPPLAKAPPRLTVKPAPAPTPALANAATAASTASTAKTQTAVMAREEEIHEVLASDLFLVELLEASAELEKTTRYILLAHAPIEKRQDDEVQAFVREFTDAFDCLTDDAALILLGGKQGCLMRKARLADASSALEFMVTRGFAAEVRRLPAQQ